jgi:peroxiredoxin
MKEMKKIFLLMTIVAFAWTVTNSFPAKVFADERKQAADFSLPDINGKNLSLSSFRGKVVILSFWATWCPSCKEEMPRFNTLYNEMKSRGLEIVAVSSDYSLGYLKDYLSDKNFNFTILFDEKRTVTRQYRIPYLPVTFLIDKKGLIVEKIPGEFEWPSAGMQEKLEKLLR